MNPKTEQHSPLIADDVYRIVMANKDTLEAAIDYRRDFEYEYFGYKTLERSYLTKLNGQIVERPQHLLVSSLLTYTE